MKVRKAIAAVVLVLLAGAGALLWFSRERRPVLTLASPLAQSGGVAVRVDRFELAWEQPGGLRRMPPVWMMQYPWLTKAWVRLNLKTQHVYDGLVWVVVDATIASDQPLQPADVDYRLDYGSYTIGAVQSRSFRTELGHPYAVGARFEVTDGPLPKALEIQVKGEWLRFPITSAAGL